MVLLKTLAGVKGIGFVAIMAGLIWVILTEDDHHDGEAIKFNGDVSDGDDIDSRDIPHKIREKYAPATMTGLLAILEILIDVGFIIYAK